MSEQTDYIIVGQGIAGTCLASFLEKKGQSFIIFDNPDFPKASAVAAGMMNPVVFRRFTTSWKGPEALEFSKSFYREHEKEFGDNFLHEKLLLKVLANEQEIEFWETCAKHENMLPFLNPTPKKLTKEHNEVVVGEVNQCANLDVPVWLNHCKEKWEKQGVYKAQKFEYSELEYGYNGVSYQGIKAKKVIFCEGIQTQENPLFPPLKFKPAKGELMEIYAPKSNLKEILKKGIFILPKPGNRYLVGATYEWDDLTHEPTQKGIDELTSKFEKLSNVDYAITDTRAGIRPTVPDRRALIGFHPNHPTLAVFNGLGTKGCLHGPYLADYFTDILIGESLEVDDEINIQRFWNYY